MELYKADKYKRVTCERKKIIEFIHSYGHKVIIYIIIIIHKSWSQKIYSDDKKNVIILEKAVGATLF